MASVKKDMKQLLARLEADKRCTVGRTSKGHPKVTRPGYPPVFMSGTSSDHHAVRNAKADLKRYLDIDLDAEAA